MLWCCCGNELTGCLGAASQVTFYDDPFDNPSIDRSAWAGPPATYLISGGMLQWDGTGGALFGIRGHAINSCVDSQSWPIGEYIEVYQYARGQDPPVTTFPSLENNSSIQIGTIFLEYLIQPATSDTDVRIRDSSVPATYFTDVVTFETILELRMRVTKTASLLCTIEAWVQGILVHTETGADLPGAMQGAGTTVRISSSRVTSDNTPTGFDSDFGFLHMTMERSW